MSLLRRFGNRIVGRDKSIDEHLNGMDGVYSLLKGAPESLFEVKYIGKDKKHVFEEVYPERLIYFLQDNIKQYPNTKIACKHTVFSGKHDDRHYIEISHSTNADNINAIIKYHTVKQ